MINLSITPLLTRGLLHSLVRGLAFDGTRGVSAFGGARASAYLNSFRHFERSFRHNLGTKSVEPTNM
ncbi:MAG: hypothetical protein HOP17_08845 [Acidobacteria bacterium]|nr:hypothetical protein [Acidobacteriota bacterium]